MSFSCDACNDRLPPADPSWFLAPAVVVGGDEEWVTNQYGEFLARLYLCDSCADELFDTCASACENIPPVQTGEGVLQCDFCESVVAAGEPFVRADQYESHWGPRRPNDEPTREMLYSDHKVICRACVRRAQDVGEFGSTAWNL